MRTGTEKTPHRRRAVLLVIGVAGLVLLIRILTVHNPEQETPFLSSNDISRWATVRALVDHGEYAVDDIIDTPEYRTVDLVRHPDRDGVERTYSSKPVLYPTVIAAPYALLHSVGVEIVERPFLVGRVTLILTMLVPLLLYLLALALLLERLTGDAFTQIFLLVAAAFAT